MRTNFYTYVYPSKDGCGNFPPTLKEFGENEYMKIITFLVEKKGTFLQHPIIRIVVCIELDFPVFGVVYI